MIQDKAEYWENMYDAVHQINQRMIDEISTLKTKVRKLEKENKGHN